MSAKLLVKPTKHTKTYFDWHEVEEYLEKKYSKELRNWAGKKFNGKPDDAPYQDFWHWIVDSTGFSGNGGSFSLYRETIDDNDIQWVKDILTLVFKEFGRGKDEIEFVASW